MSNPITNRYEFLFLFDCENGNPNGDPDAGNAPRIDPEDMHGLVSDVAVKRRIRNYVQIAKGNKMPNAIFVEQASNLNRPIALAHEKTNGGLPTDKKKATKMDVSKARQWMCDNFFDVRAFGAVMSTGPNAGQVRGPVQIAFSRSLDPILPLDISITRMAVADDVKGPRQRRYRTLGSRTTRRLASHDGPEVADPLRPVPRQGIHQRPSGQGSKDNPGTGFSDDDLNLLFEAVINMYEHDRSASKGVMTVRKLYVFKHVGTDTNAEQRQAQAMLGCAPAQNLFSLIQPKLNDDVQSARKFGDYTITVDHERLPAGVELIEML